MRLVRGRLCVSLSLSRSIRHPRNLLRREQKAVLIASKQKVATQGGIECVVERGLRLAIRAGCQMGAHVLGLDSLKQTMGEQRQAR
jgi:hypothetical protein